MLIQPVILCGGSGTRLWPLSRQLYPKQLLSFGGDASLLQATVQRLQGFDKVLDPIAVCNEAHRFLVAEQFRDAGISCSAIILEPEARNTAPAITLATLAAREQQIDEEIVLLVLPSDHLIQDLEAFHVAVQQAVELADRGLMVTFGVPAETPETGYGYIRTGAPVGPGFAISQFIEKPPLEKAKAYVEQEGFYWNSGMFVFSVAVLLEELAVYQVDMLKQVSEAWSSRSSDHDFIRPDASLFAASPADSIDYAVMEHTRHAAMVPLQAGWSDIGSWQALWKVGDKDDQGNVVSGDVLVHDTTSSYIHAEHRIVAVAGLEEAVVVETADAVLVASLEKSQQVKELVAGLALADREERLTHRKVSRPWGYFEALDHGPRFQVKRIMVSPGARLSLQKHAYRAEHWVVVSGRARVTRDEEVFELSENESTYIPVGAIHRLENPDSRPLEIIEIQSGSYLGEDDIVRIDDQYGRVKEEILDK
ncbi:MAG: mannose-1-phosphate guanylyltransferase/mannose-6-phosphate isomerase [Gammaproteobacteria bacterium]|jgi:mannose-1-phosphate guanylyltransferase|nr:mannose-1-phosphate guanylyltransferase/mannose-6-phosphate isomerase [Gammaproteobacteria bacterium]MBT5203902.1 mannose-1-phosphate guanylyltransferase/mannose-6-phosphate isomerase [Gammaproteobacteria bacterium]MBT5603680.1 mannose-1-phosphate guanylyltransferase/mannose-6-phosphate isomerase [Gammaproteobacteria bacterium]MBT6245356.1 mannose-1-phosphate guanylyltransferase/mannose-6-phosphate isomerase [Gammaproteobacteria bacterium]